ncbi:hypothetical protein SAMD00023353_0101600 [Rosellinia necatrix]|uniref:Uncharacterized protein n=1 Tax=Rosellinia necatrix TaxID=77044 RepID=A0A1S8A4X5_ROSNE|nr:hypothetical protein SAMD00023353_0101600 [Rosellinia necatrix]
MLGYGTVEPTERPLPAPDEPRFDAEMGHFHWMSRGPTAMPRRGKNPGALVFQVIHEPVENKLAHLDSCHLQNDDISHTQLIGT